MESTYRNINANDRMNSYNGSKCNKYLVVTSYYLSICITLLYCVTVLFSYTSHGTACYQDIYNINDNAFYYCLIIPLVMLNIVMISYFPIREYTCYIPDRIQISWISMFNTVKLILLTIYTIYASVFYTLNNHCIGEFHTSFRLTGDTILFVESLLTTGIFLSIRPGIGFLSSRFQKLFVLMTLLSATHALVILFYLTNLHDYAWIWLTLVSTYINLIALTITCFNYQYFENNMAGKMTTSTFIQFNMILSVWNILMLVILGATSNLFNERFNYAGTMAIIQFVLLVVNLMRTIYYKYFVKPEYEVISL